MNPLHHEMLKLLMRQAATAKAVRCLVESLKLAGSVAEADLRRLGEMAASLPPIVSDDPEAESLDAIHREELEFALGIGPEPSRPQLILVKGGRGEAG
jgi:hypothetical protein